MEEPQLALSHKETSKLRCIILVLLRWWDLAARLFGNPRTLTFSFCFHWNGLDSLYRTLWKHEAGFLSTQAGRLTMSSFVSRASIRSSTVAPPFLPLFLRIFCSFPIPRDLAPPGWFLNLNLTLSSGGAASQATTSSSTNAAVAALKAPRSCVISL